MTVIRKRDVNTQKSIARESTHVKRALIIDTHITKMKTIETQTRLNL